MTTEYKKESEWKTCRDCGRQFRESDGKTTTWFDGKPICRPCEDNRGTW